MKQIETDNTINLMSRINERANRFILAELEKREITDIAPSHGAVLAALFRDSELTMSEIAQRVNRDRSTVTNSVNKLIDSGYLATMKNAQDSRSTLVFLTPKGRELEPAFFQISQSLAMLEYQGISAEEREIFRKVLERIYMNFS
ncbi:transcriptional regulator, MarR family [Desulfitobacterium hafniense DCB-2]|nr:transcriptional regulator, MarR family [Desulfitobacterium hafniense DCB-2]EHL08533.1 transcriptional regulator, MarR family [Desulfitobacterium hafniense DP7]CDX03794.1 Transcriptional regulator, MarR [Desulfitobacterium hafniense]